MLDNVNTNLEFILSSCSQRGTFLENQSSKLDTGVKILSSPSQVLEAFRLRYKMYENSDFKNFFKNSQEMLFSKSDLTSVIIGYYSPLSNSSNSTLLGTLSLDIGDVLKSEYYGLDVSNLRRESINLAELHGLAIDRKVCRRAFNPLFNSMVNIGRTCFEIDAYLMVMRDELVKLYRNFKDIEVHKTFDSFMSIDVSQSALIYTPIKIIKNNSTPRGEM
ncbi:MAG: hypothetical protein LAT82_04565 [Nanoarchaeota archaeon]|nr:hypothetical protein [Nanoarchaeota archaeon]